MLAGIRMSQGFYKAGRMLGRRSRFAIRLYVLQRIGEGKALKSVRYYVCRRSQRKNVSAGTNNEGNVGVKALAASD